MPYPNEHACRIKQPGLFIEKTYSRLTQQSDGKIFHILTAKLQSSGKKATQALRYPKTSWSAEQAKNHCKEHGGITFEPATEE